MPGSASQKQYHLIKKHPVHKRAEIKMSDNAALMSINEDSNDFTFKNDGKVTTTDLAKTGMFGIADVSVKLPVDNAKHKVLSSNEIQNQQGLKPAYETPDCYNATFFHIPAKLPAISI